MLFVGLALLLNPLVPGVHLGSGTVYRYEAATVEYAAGQGFDLRYVRTGRRLEPVAVDDQIACEDWRDRWFCRVATSVERNGGVPAHASAGLRFPSRYEFVLLDGRLYRPTTTERSEKGYLTLEPANESDPLRAVAGTDLSAVEERAVESGRVVTYRRLRRTDQLLRHEGDYYVVRRTARKEYTRGRDSCHGSPDGFCDAADWKRRTDTALTLGSRLAGVVLVFLSWERIRQ